MSNFQLPLFGDVNPRSLEEYYEQDIELGGKVVRIDLNFEMVSVSEKKLVALQELLAQLPTLQATAWEAFQQDLATKDTIKQLLRFFLDEKLDKTVLADLLANAKEGNSDEEKLLSAFELKRIGFFPEQENEFVIMDYSLPNNINNYLVVAYLNSKGKVTVVEIED
ncbi:uncharacterized protein DUF2004 [Chitinophaga skermanii]|uniref:Uncharacterized protein DUF2004 n=1 Tax=Chitinophaga skermanii TaxID=331697 RepID=A0A327QYW0_9BACT|nr:DUF2004 domain-containing protein [Chitinophaga skermanii]RAJ08613.1 uncharacterized protein DUF2004 [Chitinophaga skermanii]